MKRIVFAGAVLLLAACGSSSPGVSGGTASEQTSAASAPSSTAAASTVVTTTPTSADTTATAPSGTTAGSTADTISVSNFGDMPPACVDLFTKFLKQIEPKVSVIDWNTATLADFEAFGKDFQSESASFDTDSKAAGCDKYNFEAPDAEVFKQISELAATAAPGTLPFLQFLNSLSAAATANAGTAPADCAGTIAAIEPFLGTGKTMKDLTMTEVTRLGGLIRAVSTKCTAEESTAFFARPDVTAFVSG